MWASRARETPRARVGIARGGRKTSLARVSRRVARVGAVSETNGEDASTTVSSATTRRTDDSGAVTTSGRRAGAPRRGEGVRRVRRVARERARGRDASTTGEEEGAVRRRGVFAERGRADAESIEGEREGEGEKKKLGKKARRAAFSVSVALNKEISSCETVKELVETTRGRASDASGVNVSTAYSKLAKFRRAEADAVDEAVRSLWFDELERAAVERLDDMKPRAVAQLTWALGHLRLGRRDDGSTRDALWDGLERVIESAASEFESQGVANVCWTYGKLEMRVPIGIRVALENNVVRNAATFKPYELSISFWALTKLGDAPREEVTNAVERSLSLAQCRPQELANVASAYGRVKGCGSSAFLSRLAEESFACLPEFGHTELAMLLWGLSNAGHYLRDHEAAIALAEVQRRADALSPHQIALVAGSLATFSDATDDENARSCVRLRAAMDERFASALRSLEESFLASIGESNCDDLSYVIWAFAHLSHQPSDAFGRKFEDEAISKLDSCNSKNLANMMYGVGTLRLPSVSLFTHATFCVSEKLSEFTPVEIFMVCSALASSNHDPGSHVMSQLENTVMDSIESLDSADLTEFLRVFARLRYMLADETFDAIGARSAVSLERYDSYRMSMTLWSYATLCRQPDESMLERFQDELRGSTAAFKSENFGLALWSLVVLGSLEDASPLVESLTRALVDINRGVLSSPDALSDTTLCSLYMARLVARESPFESLVSLSTDAVADDCERAWIGMKSKDPTYSNLQHAIAEELREFGVHGFTLETPVEGGRMRPDIVFENHRVVVEVDGPHHYSYDALGRRRALGTTVMRDKLLESWGWRVRVIPYHEWADLLSSDEKRAYLRQLLGDDVFDGNAA